MEAGVCLNIWHHDLGVFSKVPEESVTTPVAHDFHGLKRHLAQQIVEGGSYVDSVTL